MILIPAGTFLKGTPTEQARALAAEYGYHESWITCESPQQEIHLPAYRIDQYPVTNAQYQIFCKETGHPLPRHCPTPSRLFPAWGPTVTTHIWPPGSPLA